MLLRWSVVLFVSFVLANEEPSLLVKIQQGPVKGYKLPNFDVFAFYGIPYATAPTGVNRFRGPLPPPTWDEPFEATENNIICPQNNNHFQTFDGMQVLENCLVATIYVPNTNKTNLPVIAYVHGGAYQTGHANRLTPKHVVHNKDVIVASFNYRLGAHGFLCLGTKNIPGNAGMKDQVAFLRWLQKNIASFGGNPNDVTIYGNSAGSRSVDLLMISKATNGLFKKFIGDSGGSLSDQTVQVNPLQNAKSFAQMLKFDDVDDINALETFYLNASYEVLTSIDTTVLKDYLFTPCVERDVGDEVVLDKSPFDILKSGEYAQVPMLYGFTEMEGTYRLPTFQDWKEEMNINFSSFLPADLQFPSENEKEEITKKVEEYYLGKDKISEANILLFVNYFTDTMYVHPILRAIQLHLEAGHKNIYSYEYSFTSPESPKIDYTDIPASTHSSQTTMFFDSEMEHERSDEYKEMKRIIREMYTNFAKFGEPCPHGSSLPYWPSITKENIQIMSLNQTLEMKPLQHRATFWDDVYAKYYRNPSSPTVSV
ncbi:juvenile hormone esterase-like [Pieris napi]|uniref:juvenile hormone esterase-like n=1 Tax=Pieris napi TaxID=78633 RepID=UPI001FB89818|nr:juvenile hormone esterase-like [Pieris napi]